VKDVVRQDGNEINLDERQHPQIVTRNITRRFGSQDEQQYSVTNYPCIDKLLKNKQYQICHWIWLN